MNRLHESEYHSKSGLERLPIVSSIDTEFCPDHPREIITFSCETCDDKGVCPVCIDLTHKTHDFSSLSKFRLIIKDRLNNAIKFLNREAVGARSFFKAKSGVTEQYSSFISEAEQVIKQQAVMTLARGNKLLSILFEGELADIQCSIDRCEARLATLESFESNLIKLYEVNFSETLSLPTYPLDDVLVMDENVCTRINVATTFYKMELKKLEQPA